ncbi:MAG: VWA domain-containing protein [Rhabdochlamydiaceae bacterium]|nr:VWA domain-containing protein [Rhabdochlamydiaceae bacterium]
MFHFYWIWAALLFPVPFLVRKFVPVSSKDSEKESCELYFPAADRLRNVFPTYSVEKKPSGNLCLILLSLLWFFLVLTLMQPERVDQFTQVKNTGYDLMLAVDISSSMQAVDFSTRAQVISRLDVTKEVVGKFVLGRQGDRVGLVTFGENAYLHVPLTLDTVSVSRMLNDTVAGMAGNATAIGDAIGLSVKTLRDRPEGSRVLVLLTDGDDNASSIPPLEAANLAKQYGIRIYTIGVGRNGPVPFPTQTGGYALANVTMDEVLLKEIANITGGQYFLATDQKALQSIYDKIDVLEKTEANHSTFFVRKPLYYYPLGAAMLTLFALSLSQIRYRRVLNES